MLDDYYLVPFGREPGGLLDLLGLPPNADPREVRGAAAKRLKEFGNELKAKYRDLREKQKKGEITKEEFEVRGKEFEAEASRREAEFNKLKAAWDNEQNQERKFANDGRAIPKAGWVTIAPATPAITAPGALPQVSKAFLDDVAARWLNPGQDAGAFPNLPSSRHAGRASLDPGAIARLAVERDLVQLLWADVLWERLDGTHRTFWRQRMGDWRLEAERLAATMSVRPGRASSGKVVWSRLARPRTLQIDHLETVDIEEVAQRPHRPGQSAAQMDMETILALLRDLGIDEPAEAGEHGDRRLTSDEASGPSAEDIRALFERLARENGGEAHEQR